MPATIPEPVLPETVRNVAQIRSHRRSRSWRTRFFSALGPGLIAGAADDDPAGIATYSSAGALLGTSQLWTAFVTWPLMASVQMTCARIAMASGKGLAGALREKLPRPVLMVTVLGLLVANTFNIAADLAGMADAAEMLSGFNSHYFVVLFALAITGATMFFRYDPIAKALKWLTLSLFAYLITALIIRPPWQTALHATFVPSLPATREEWEMLVAILGTTISPYLFFWQASQEVEEGRSTEWSKRAQARLMHVRVATRRLDVGVGTLFSNVGMYFIILTTALTLHRNGIIHIDTSRQAAEALRPLAGSFAALLFTLGIIGVGFLAIPTMSASAAYAVAEIFNWRAGLSNGFKSARGFYGIIIVATSVGIAIDFANINAIRALFWSAVLNGLLAPALLIAILFIASDRRIMRGHPVPLLTIGGVALTAVLMIGAAIGMFLL